jgi:hypothetical protein
MHQKMVKEGVTASMDSFLTANHKEMGEIFSRAIEDSFVQWLDRNRKDVLSELAFRTGICVADEVGKIARDNAEKSARVDKVFSDVLEAVGVYDQLHKGSAR